MREKKKIEVKYKNVLLHHCFYSDFIAYDKVIVEVKATQKGFAEEHEKQLINYLAVSKCRVGLLINFGTKALEYKRIIL